MPGLERRRLVEEEELRELPGCRSGELPTLKTSRHAIQRFAGKAPADMPGLVVQAPAVPVDEPASGIGDEFAERCHPVPRRHATRVAAVKDPLTRPASAR